MPNGPPRRQVGAKPTEPPAVARLTHAFDGSHWVHLNGGGKEGPLVNEPGVAYLTSHWFAGASNPDEADYWYTLKYCLSHIKAAAEEC